MVDDDELNRDALSQRLQERGYEVSEASSGFGALELVERHQFDLVLLDVVMPSMSGYEVLQRIRIERSAGELPVIMVTGRDGSVDIVEALALGANDYVVKPIDLAIMLARIETQLQRRRVEAQIREREDHYAAAMAGATDGIWDWTLATNQLYCSEPWRVRFGLGADGAAPTVDEWFGHVHEDDRARMRGEIDSHIAGLSAHLQVEYRWRDRSDRYRWVSTRGLAVRDSAGRAVRLAGSFADITEGKEVDPLTSASSRVLFMDRLVQFVEMARRRRDFSYAVLLLGFHGLKLVNETHGRLMGDRLLVAAARRLERQTRKSGPFDRSSPSSDARYTVARLDGDEFAILLPGVRDADEAARVARDICNGFAAPIVLDGHEMYVTANVGILAAAARYTSPEEVLRDASVALSLAKARGRSQHEVFEPGMRNQRLVRQRVESSLRPALDRGEFRLHYQPIVRLDRETLVGFEALLRWQHPERGLVQPDEFVPLAEEADLIVGIGRWVVHEACRQLAAWRDAGLGTDRTCVSINLSIQEFQQPDLVNYIGRALREFRLDGHRIEVEITESTAMACPDLVAARLSQLRALGVSVCLDDFGAGHSSLAYLHQLPVNKVKIDRSFVARLFAAGDRDSRPIVRAVLAMARDMGIEVVAEGVEEIGQFDLLCGLSCQFGQGYLFARPADAGAATSLLRDGLGDADWRVGQQSLLPGPGSLN